MNEAGAGTEEAEVREIGFNVEQQTGRSRSAHMLCYREFDRNAALGQIKCITYFKQQINKEQSKQTNKVGLTSRTIDLPLIKPNCLSENK